jgi:hypothetical protein
MIKKEVEQKNSWRIPPDEGFFRHVELVSTILIILLLSILTTSNIFAGFIFWLYLVLVGGSFAITIFYPRSGFYAIVFLTFIWERFFTLAPIIIDRHEYKIYSIDIILIGVILGVVVKLIKLHIINKKNKANREVIALKKRLSVVKKPIALLSVFILLIGAHFLVDVIIFGANKSVAVSSLKYYTFYPLLYFVTIILFSRKKDIIRLFKFALLAGVIIIGFIVFGVLSGGGLWSEFTPMSTSGFRVLAFTHGFYLAMLWLGVFIFIVKKKSLRNKLIEKKWLAVLLIWGIGILGSMMRHLWLGLGLSIAIFIILYVKKKDLLNISRQLTYYLPGALLGLFLIIYLAIIFPYSTIGTVVIGAKSAVTERVVSFANVKQDSSFSWRNLAWREASIRYLDNPIYGLGFGKSLDLESENYHDFVEVRNIHNSWLVLAVQSGAVIFTIFMVFVFNITKTFFRKQQDKEWTEVVVQILIINYFFIALFQPYLETNMLGIFFWILLGVSSSQKSKILTSKEGQRGYLKRGLDD